MRMKLQLHFQSRTYNISAANSPPTPIHIMYGGRERAAASSDAVLVWLTVVFWFSTKRIWLTF